MVTLFLCFVSRSKENSLSICIFVYMNTDKNLYAILDVETTGGNAFQDKITEIAIYLHDGEKVVDEFTSLINPECSIPPFISRLTGIYDEMVENAPKFYEVAKDIIQFTEGATIVAHNAQFDYGFIRQEYKTLGYSFSRDYLCTVKLSRKLIPGYRSYSLGNLCEQLGIVLENRHRAHGDAQATVKLFELLLEKDAGRNVMDNQVKNDYLNLRFPPEFDRTILDKLPEHPGVYYLYNVDGTLIYIGKSNNIRKRILSHFSNKQSRKAIELRNAIRDISFESTGSELIALLPESDEIKKKQPLFNRAQRHTFFNFGIFLETDENGYITLKASKVKNGEQPIFTFHSQEEAKEMLEKWVQKYKLCQKLCGLYDIAHACFHYSIHQCNGACIGKEKPEKYNLRVEQALENLQFTNSNFMILGPGRNTAEKSVVMIENGKYQGYGYFEPEFISTDPDQIRDLIQFKQDNRDIHRILKSHIDRIPKNLILPY